MKLYTKLCSLLLAAVLAACMPAALRGIGRQLYPCRYDGVIESYAAEYEMDPKAPEFCIGIIEKTLCHQQGEKLDGGLQRGGPRPDADDRGDL